MGWLEMQNQVRLRRSRAAALPSQAGSRAHARRRAATSGQQQHPQQAQHPPSTELVELAPPRSMTEPLAVSSPPGPHTVSSTPMYL